MRTALILGGTGQIGTAISSRLRALGWSVTTASRSEHVSTSQVPHKIIDASSADSLKEVLSKPTDLLVSCVAFDEDDALALLAVRNQVGRIVSISSASVYQDRNGLTLDESREQGFPVFDGPIDEQCQTVAPSSKTYSTRKMRMEKALLEQDSVPVTILRPCAVHGPYSKHAREWWFVKRLLDGRRTIPLAYGGNSQFHTTSVEAIADAVLLSADGKLPAIANVCDADAPTVNEIGQSIMNIMGIEAELVGIESNAYPTIAGSTPWSIPLPFTFSSVAPAKLTYAESVPATIEWLTKYVTNDNWKTMIPQLAGYPYDHFDYSVDEDCLKS